MQWVGLAIFIGVTAFMLVFDYTRDFLVNTYLLSPEITILIGIGYLYPFILYFIGKVFRSSVCFSRKFYITHVSMSGNFCVSLGLIGTFIGLSSMVAAIASGMNAGGDFSEQIGALLQSIGSSLDAMSLAFLTSILGVGAGTIIAVACNYLATSFVDYDDQVPASVGQQDNYDQFEKVTNHQTEQLANVIQSTVSGLKIKEAITSIEGSTAEQQNLSRTLNKLEETQANLLEAGLKPTVQSFEKITQTFERYDNLMIENNKLFQDFASGIDSSIQSLHGLTESIQQSGETMLGAISSINDRFDQLEGNINSISDLNSKNSQQLSGLITHNIEVQEKLNESIKEMRKFFAAPLQDVIKKGIENNTIELLYQPTFNNKEHIIGFESTLRITDEVHGEIDNNIINSKNMRGHPELMLQLDQYVIKKAMAKLSKWIQIGKWQENWHLSFNLTFESINSLSLIDEIQDTVDLYGIDPKFVAFEFKEPSFTNKNELPIKQLRQLSRLGFKVGIDNYGTANLSLTFYKSLPVDYIKIDPTFTNNIENENSDLAIIKSILLAADELSFKLIAVGIESEAQKRIYQELGIYGLQGKYMGSPEINIPTANTLDE